MDRGQGLLMPLQDTPSSRIARAGEFGRTAVKMSTVLGRAAALGLVRRDTLRAEVWHEAHLRAAAELLQTLGRMRGAAAKFGQLLAQRPGLLPEEYLEAMLALSYEAPPLGYGIVKTQFWKEFGRKPTDMFASFERAAFAAASFGQVHRARLQDGTEVAVKVQYPAMERTVRSDFDNLRLFVEPLERVANVKGARDALAELREHVLAELDYRREAENAAEFASRFAGDEDISIPQVHTAISGDRILTLDYCTGSTFTTYLASDPPFEERQRFSRQLLEFGWKCVFRHRLLHADPNPGNFLFGEQQLHVLDFGCVKRFSEETVSCLRSLIHAAMTDDDATLERALREGELIVSAREDEKDAAKQVARLWARPFRTPDFDFGDRAYLSDMVRLQDLLRGVVKRRQAIPVPSQLVLYGRHLIGQTYLLFRLGARGRFRELIAPYVSPAD